MSSLELALDDVQLDDVQYSLDLPDAFVGSVRSVTGVGRWSTRIALNTTRRSARGVLFAAIRDTILCLGGGCRVLSRSRLSFWVVYTVHQPPQEDEFARK